MTKDIGALLARGRQDVIFFGEEILGVKINRAQRRWFRTITKDDQWLAKLSVHVSANQCLAAGEFLNTPSGIVPVEDAKRGLVTVDGAVVNDPTVFEDDLYEIVFTNGLRVRTNGEHPFWTGYHGSGNTTKDRGWMTAESLRPGTFIALRPAPDLGGELIPDARLWGYLLSDGTMSKGQSIKFTNNRSEFLDDVESLAREHFGLASTRRAKNKGFDLYPTDGNKGTRSPIRQRAGNLGVSADTFGRLQAGDINSLSEFVRGFFNGDGYLLLRKDRYPEIGFAIGSSRQRAYELQFMLWRLGVLSWVKKEWMKKSTKPFYRVKVGRSVPALLPILDTTKYPEKFERASELLAQREYQFQTPWTTVRRVVALGRGTAVAISTESGEITSYAGLRTHNTGKSLGVGILILWASVYKIGVPTVDPKFWYDAPYDGFHVAPDQERAYIPLRDIRQLVKGAHLAQEKGAKKFGLKCHFPESLIRFEKHEHYYDGFTTLAGATAQFRTTADKAASLQGRRAAWITFDEAAFEDHLTAVINEALMMRLISTGGPLIIVSTPDGMNAYYELVENILLRSKVVPDTDGMVYISNDGWALIRSVVSDNEGFGLESTEIERMERDLDPVTKEQQLRGAFLNPSDAFFLPQGDIAKAFKSGMSLEGTPLPGHVYIIFWDPSVAMDPTAGYVLDVTGKRWKVIREIYYHTPRGINSLIPEMIGQHHIYGTAANEYMGQSKVLTGYDETGFGGKIIGQMLAGLTPKRGLDSSGTSKTKLDVLMNLKAALLPDEDGNTKLEIPEELVGLKREILNYRLVDKDIQQDRVMALGGAAWLAAKGFSGKTSAGFDPSASVARSMWR